MVFDLVLLGFPDLSLVPTWVRIRLGVLRFDWSKVAALFLPNIFGFF